jgi:hypothetical protein
LALVQKFVDDVGIFQQDDSICLECDVSRIHASAELFANITLEAFFDNMSKHKT